MTNPKPDPQAKPQTKSWAKSYGKFWILCLIPVLLLLDQWSKYWGLSLGDQAQPFIGSMRFIPVMNEGFMGGGGHDGSVFLRIVYYATFLGPLLLGFSFFAYQLYQKTKRVGSIFFFSLWVIGITGNIMDRVWHGAVIDFIQYYTRSFQVTFNLADMYQAFGSLMFFIFLFSDKSLFIENNQRSFRWIDRRFQLFYVLKILMANLFLVLTLFIFSYTFLKFYLFEEVSVKQQNMLVDYTIRFWMISGIFLLMVGAIGFSFSKKLAGPVYAFSRYINDLKSGKSYTFKLRKDDQMMQLEDLALTIQSHWSKTPKEPSKQEPRPNDSTAANTTASAQNQSNEAQGVLESSLAIPAEAS